MTSDHNPEQQGSPTDPCDRCPGRLDELTCEAEGVKARNTYNDQQLERLTTARQNYRAARALYTTARDEARPKVDQARVKLDQAIEQLKCLIKDPAIVTCLDDAYTWVIAKLDACAGGSSGCCLPPGENGTFDTDCADTAEAIAGRLAAFHDRIEAATRCFDQLMTEPDALKTRVADAVKEIDVIVSLLKGTEAPLDHRRLYAQALLARRSLDQAWRGFADVNAFVACACQALMTMVEGHRAYGELLGRQATLVCMAKAKQTCCDNLRKNLLVELLAHFLKHCTHVDTPEKPTGCC